MGGRSSSSGMQEGAGGKAAILNKLQKIKINEDWAYQPEPGLEKDARKNPIPFVGVGKDMELDEKLNFDFSTRVVSVQDNVEVEVSSLKTLQPIVSVGGISRALDGNAGMGNPVQVVEYKGQMYIMDGNHRAATAKLTGKKTIRARVTRRVDV